MARDSEITSARALLQAIESTLAARNTATLITVVGGTNSVGAKLLVTDDGLRYGSLNDPDLQILALRYLEKFNESRHQARTLNAAEIEVATKFDTDTRLLFELIAPEPRLIVCGAGHVGAELAKLGPALGFATTVIDDRPELLNVLRSSSANIDICAINDWGEGIRAAIGNGRNTYVAIVTRGHREDEECLGEVLRLRPNYVGMIGSRRRTNIVLDRLRAAGFPDAVLEQVRAPIGLDIGAVSPAEVALAIAAEIVAERRNGSGAPLSAWRRG